jgi:ipoprotein LpqH
VTVNSVTKDLHVVKCSQMDWTRTLDIGSNFAGAKVIIDEHAQQPIAESVHIQNLGGFTGMYSRGGDANADTSMDGDKFTITGTANGYKVDKPNEPASATFKITVRC